MKYYPIVKNWHKIRKHLNNKELNNILNKDFNKFTYRRRKQKFPSQRGRYPGDFESCDWDIGRRLPEVAKYVKHSACHWLVNFNLKMAQLVKPNKNWRIVTSQEHLTVWGGQNTLFDFNFLIMEISPNESFRIANKDNIQLEIRKLMKVYIADPF